MIQTYEGALTETDSILQRMKTLADQAANGTYQDDVDRDAIQLEFNQLNDELDQIADTDFNGVVVLNGGQMADGTKAVNGKFDYANNARQARQLTKSELVTFDNTSFAAKPVATNGKGTNADLAWKNWSTGNAWDRITDPNDLTKYGPEEFNITFTYDGNGQWKATSASDTNIDLDAVNTCLNNVAGSKKGAGVNTGNVNNGGFTLVSDSNKVDTTSNDKTDYTVADVVVDTSKLKAGDTITLTFKNPKLQNAAPGNPALEVSYNGLKAAGNAIDPSDADARGVVKVGNDDKDETYVTLGGSGKRAMTKTGADSYNALQGATITATYTEGKVSSMKVTLKDGSEIEMDTTANSTGTLNTKDGIALSFAATADTGELVISDATGAALFTITPTENMSTDADGEDGCAYNGNVSYGLSFSEVVYSDEKASVEVLEKASDAVSNANAYSQATAPLTYTDHVALQAGARTKDLVDFTFKYTCGGMGDLKANLDCSSRAGGLGTAGLKLTDQKSANYAIDRIDNAINKVSMVRATFGAVQNRLEHKIDNMNVTKENITSAESRIRDTNMAEEMTNFTKNQILSQASQAMLAQANQLPQGVLQLLG